MDWGTIAAIISALAAAVSAWVAYREYQDKKNTGQPRSAQRSAPPSVLTQYRSVELRSERGVDYTKLRDLLAAGNWKEADQETDKVMCQAAGRGSEGWLRVKDIDNFPYEDLRIINQLWLHYSDGKFGFSVQKEIYESLGGTREYNEKVFVDFCARVGWRKGGNWLNYSELTFNLNAPTAHLPWRDRGFCARVGWHKLLFHKLLFSVIIYN